MRHVWGVVCTAVWMCRALGCGSVALADAPRSGRPKTVDEAAILARTLEPPPAALAGLPEIRGTRSTQKVVASRGKGGSSRKGSCYYSEPGAAA